MLAAIRPDSWNFPLFLHVLGAMILFGATATVAIVGFAGRSRPDYAGMLSRVALNTFLLGIVPSWIVMRVAAQWIVGKEFPDEDAAPGWVDVGFLVSEPGAILLIVLGILAWLSVRRGRPFLAVPLLATLYVLALGVAWFAMSAKP
jgi:hypothetical protein